MLLTFLTQTLKSILKRKYLAIVYSSKKWFCSLGEESEERLPVLEEEREPVKNGFLANGIEDISDRKTFASKSENLSRDLLPDIKYLDLLEGKETDL